jgi:hypothetical protein
MPSNQRQCSRNGKGERTVFRILVVKQKGNYHLGDEGEDRRITTWIFKEWDVSVDQIHLE